MKVVERGLDLLADSRSFEDESREPGPRDVLFALTFRHQLRPALRVRRELLQRRDDALELVQRGIVGSQNRRQRIERELEGARRLPGVDRQRRVTVLQRQLTVVEEDDELAALEDAAVLVAEDRQQQLGVQLHVLRRPLDIEEIGRRRAWTVLEHVVPARVSSGADAHVVRHEISEVAEPVLGERSPESIECSQFRQAQD